MDIITVILQDTQIILGFFFLLFIPGFAISLVYFPYPNDIRLFERLIYSIILSIGSVIVLVLLMDVVLGINTTPRNIGIIICAFSIFALIVWKFEKMFRNYSKKLNLKSSIFLGFQSVRNHFKKIKDSLGNRISIKKG
jgi:uncharacterized membrane protein